MLALVVGLLTWVAATVIAQRLCWRAPASVGLPIAFLASVAVIHVPGALVHVLPWYDRPTRSLVEDGFALSAIGALFLALGHAWHQRRQGHRAPERARPTRSRASHAWSRRAGIRFLVTGLVIHLLVLPLLQGVPTVTAILSAGMTLSVCGLHILIYMARARGDGPALRFWLAFTLLFPALTVVSGGYLGFGVSIVIGTICFVAGFDRPRWRPYAFVLLLLYPALCAYVTYMRDRKEIRAEVWGGAPLSRRVDVVAKAFLSPDFFDPLDEQHLYRFDERLNQNILVGQAVRHMARSSVEFAHGETIADAVFALVPRALWPDKPFRAGGAEVVTRYTGQRYERSTSVGVGTVLELYINFGGPGVCVGFFILGVVLSALDGRCGAMLAAGRQGEFLRHYLPSLSLLSSAGNSFVEVGASCVGAYLLARAVERWIDRRERKETLAEEGRR